jgi:hypothetical protein
MPPSSPSLTMKECRQQAELLGIKRRYRSKAEYTRIIAVVTTGTPDAATRDYILRDDEVVRLRRMYRTSHSTTRTKYVKSIAEVLYMRDLRDSLRSCGVVGVGFRTKEQILDALCVLWFAGKEPVFYTNEIITGAVECSICSAAVDSADNKRFRCACQYWYHGACLDRWARISPTCPTCRSAGDMPSPSPSPT